jgi:hypothetical protein
MSESDSSVSLHRTFVAAHLIKPVISINDYTRYMLADRLQLEAMSSYTERTVPISRSGLPRGPPDGSWSHSSTIIQGTCLRTGSRSRCWGHIQSPSRHASTASIGSQIGHAGYMLAYRPQLIVRAPFRATHHRLEAVTSYAERAGFHLAAKALARLTG